MIVTSTHKGHATKTVTFADVESTGDTELFATACRAMGETPSSLFGQSVERHDFGTATVRLHTD